MKSWSVNKFLNAKWNEVSGSVIIFLKITLIASVIVLCLILSFFTFDFPGIPSDSETLTVLFVAALYLALLYLLYSYIIFSRKEKTLSPARFYRNKVNLLNRKFTGYKDTTIEILKMLGWLALILGGIAGVIILLVVFGGIIASLSATTIIIILLVLILLK